MKHLFPIVAALFLAGFALPGRAGEIDSTRVIPGDTTVSASPPPDSAQVDTSAHSETAAPRECFDPRSGFWASVESGFALKPYGSGNRHTFTYVDLRLGGSLNPSVALGGGISVGSIYITEQRSDNNEYLTGISTVSRLMLVTLFFPFTESRPALRNLGFSAGLGNQVRTGIGLSEETLDDDPLVSTGFTEGIVTDSMQALALQVGVLTNLQLSNTFHLGLENALHFSTDPQIPFMITLTVGFRWF